MDADTDADTDADALTWIVGAVYRITRDCGLACYCEYKPNEKNIQFKVLIPWFCFLYAVFDLNQL